MRVAVIGAGASGIAALRHLSATPEISHVVAYEKNGEVGGTWIYTDRVGLDEQGLPVHSSMFKDLWTNIAKKLMLFGDMDSKTPRDGDSLMPQAEVLAYLNDYVDQFDIRKNIEFQTEVVLVEPLSVTSKQNQWKVKVRRLTDPNKRLETEIFDAIFVSNGINSVPFIPDIPEMDDFKGLVMHSHDFRTANAFEGQTVVCIGGGFSGIDISCILASHAKQVYLSSRNKFLKPAAVFPNGVELVPTVKEIREHSVVFEDEKEACEVDAILLCTGYRYSFPFLADVCQLKNDSGRLYPLYKHVVHIHYPNLFFIGMIKLVPFFLVTTLQVQFAVQILLDNVELPDKEAMLKDTESDYNWRVSMGMSNKRAQHFFPGETFLIPYIRALKNMDKKGALQSINEGHICECDKHFYCVFEKPIQVAKRVLLQ